MHILHVQEIPFWMFQRWYDYNNTVVILPSIREGSVLDSLREIGSNIVSMEECSQTTSCEYESCDERYLFIAHVQDATTLKHYT